MGSRQAFSIVGGESKHRFFFFFVLKHLDRLFLMLVLLNDLS